MRHESPPPSAKTVEPTEQEAPRAVIRLLRSGLLSPEREQRVLELHGEAVEGWLRAKPQA